MRLRDTALYPPSRVVDGLEGRGSGADTGQRKWENRDENGVGRRRGIGAERQRGNRQQVNWNKCRQT